MCSRVTKSNRRLRVFVSILSYALWGTLCICLCSLIVKTVLAPNLKGRKFSVSGGAMTIIKQGIKTQDMKREVREIRETARKIAASKESARRFLISTGMYSANGQIKPQYR